MSAPPYMRFYWGDYFRDTRHLNRLEHSAYMLILGEMWVKGGTIRADDETLARCALCTAAEWVKVRPAVMAFFKVSKGKLTQKRLSAEMVKYRDTISKRKAAGKIGSAVRAGKQKGTGAANTQHLPTKPKPEPEPERKKEIAKAISCPNGFEAFWNSYPRKASKLASAKAYAKALARIGGPDPQAFLLAALEVARHGWTDERFTPHASTWLNGERYNDAPPSNIVSLPHERLDGPTEKHAARISNLSEGVGVAHEIAAYRSGLAGGGG